MSGKLMWDISDKDLPAELQVARADFAEIELRLFAMFSRIRPGFPWWYWFEDENGRQFVLYVCMDGSNNLWAEIGGHGCELVPMLIRDRIKVLCAVEEPK